MNLRSANPRDLTVLHIGGYWRGANDMVRHMMLGLADTGARVVEFNTDENRDALEPDGPVYNRGTTAPVWLRPEKLDPIIKREQPDLIVCNAGGLAFRPEVADRLRERHALLGIGLSEPEVFEPTTRHIARTFDLFLTIAPRFVSRYEQTGATCGVLPLGTNPDFYHPVEPDPAFECDVFVACRALPDRIEPIKRLSESFDVHLYGEDWEAHGLESRGVIYGDAALKALTSARLSPIFLLTPSGHPLLKVGLFDFTAAGALVIANRIPEVEEHFRYGEEILGFGDTEELMDQVSYYLAHPDQASQVRRAGRERTLRDHTWSVAWQRILRWLADPEGSRDEYRNWRSGFLRNADQGV